MVSNNIPQVKLGIIAVSRDCFPIALSTPVSYTHLTLPTNSRV